MSDKKQTALNSFISFLDGLIEDCIMTNPELAADILRQNGYDPDEVGRKMAEVTRRASEKRQRKNEIDSSTLSKSDV